MHRNPMNVGRLRVRLRNRAGSAERALGLIRRRNFAVRAFGMQSREDNDIEVILEVDTTQTPIYRVRAELNSLVDLIAIEDVS